LLLLHLLLLLKLLFLVGDLGLLDGLRHGTAPPDEGVNLLKG
jgi:hypothetical protein